MKAFIYPTFDKKRDKTGNEYIRYFHESLAKSEHFQLVNRFQRSETLGIFLNLDADVFIIHWVDLIPSKPLGKLQMSAFKLGVVLARLLGKKIVWVLHNKTAHDDSSSHPMALMKWMSAHSSLVLTHSEEGCRYYKEVFSDSQAKCFFIPHPVYSSDIVPTKEKKWDYIVWGNISRRKNVLEFVKFASSCEFFKSKKILVCGLCRDVQLDKAIAETAGANIQYENSFLQENELNERIASSDCILFTYDNHSVLSSGALIYSLNFLKPIIGPRVGSFQDMEKDGIVSCFNSFEDIPSISIFQTEVFEESIKRYITDNTWQNLPDKLMVLFKTHF